MIFRKLRILRRKKWCFIILIILVFASLLITFGAPKNSFTAFRSVFEMSSPLYNVTFTSSPLYNVTFTSSPFFNVIFTSHYNASSPSRHVTEHVINEMITTSTQRTLSRTEVQTPSSSTNIQTPSSSTNIQTLSSSTNIQTPSSSTNIQTTSSSTNIQTPSPTTEARTPSTTELNKKSHKGCDTNVTLVSAFLYIGDHQKGGGKRNMAEYFEWSKAFGFIWNMLYFYTDSPMFAEHLLKVRSSLNDNLTHIIHINRSSLWPFKLRDAIARLYQDSNYPKHHPNTVVPEYSCSMHSKYACVENAIMNRSDEVTTTYYAWIDIGYFRLLKDKINYCVRLPTGYSSDKVMFNQVYNPNFDLTPKEIYYGNHVWVGGGMFIAARDTMLRFCNEYRRAVEFFLFSRNLSSTDQQCLYSSYTKSGRMDVNMTVELQIFQGNGDWFKLGTDSLQQISSNININVTDDGV